LTAEYANVWSEAMNGEICAANIILEEHIHSIVYRLMLTI
jgi:hypothetical protein